MRFMMRFFWVLLVVLACLCCFLAFCAAFAGTWFWTALFALGTIHCLWWCSVVSDVIDDMEGWA